MHIKLAHSSAYQAKIQREPLAKFDIEESELHRTTCSEDLNDLIDIATTMQIDAAIDTQENMFDFGLDFDWSFQNMQARGINFQQNAPVKNRECNC